jgi:4Fe-4S binding domain
MLSRVPERVMHRVRWVLILGWLLLIASLFYDPLTWQMTDPANLSSPFRDPALLPDAPPIVLQDHAMTLAPYPIGARLFWGMIVPSGIFIVFVFGHETWRRICPLYFFSQIPRALGFQPKLDISKNLWLQQNSLYLQFTLFFIGLCCRLLFINSDRILLGSFLLFTLLSAAFVVFLYGGRSWCHYVCPFGMIQGVLTGPRGLLDSSAHQAPAASVTQSMCRSIDRGIEKQETEKSACVNCKSPCLDIDSEKAYWEQLKKPGRKLVQYGYLGLVIGYFAYYGLYAGNFDYYFSGVWSHELNQVGGLFNPGFYGFDRWIPIPKIVAAPLTLLVFVAVTCPICTHLERAYAQRLRRQNISQEQILHRVFSVCTFLAFNIFFIYGGRPEILRLPIAMQFLIQTLFVLVSTLWLSRTWKRSADQYMKESTADKLRRQLKKLSIDSSQWGGKSLEQLTPDEVYILAKTLPGVTKHDRQQVYKGLLHDLIQAGHLNSVGSLAIIRQMQQHLGMNETDYEALWVELGSDPANAHLFYPTVPQTELRDRGGMDFPQTLIRQRR